jgi:hypothetical protein
MAEMDGHVERAHLTGIGELREMCKSISTPDLRGRWERKA